MSFQPIHDLVELCALKGIRYAVISPGSRSAPLTLAFARHSDVKCFIIPDERSAAFIALGIAQKTRQPAALVCTSGTAALNYAPAVAEAYYQQIPLLVLTADRPPEWIDQQDGQAIRQQGLYGSHVKRSFTLPVNLTNPDDAWFTNRIINEALNLNQLAPAGPVHVNVPLREPLYPAEGAALGQKESVRVIQRMASEISLPETEINRLAEIFRSSRKILVLSGQQSFHTGLRESLQEVAKSGIPLVADITANLHALESTFSSIDQLLTLAEKNPDLDIKPDLLITFGGPLLSKKIKQWLRNNPPAGHLHIGISESAADVFQCLTHHLPVTPESFFRSIWPELQKNISLEQSQYFSAWQELKKQYQVRQLSMVLPFNEMEGVYQVMQDLPENSILQLGNSMPIRYADLTGLGSRNDIEVYANRGTSGIDGSLSTAVGYALATEKTVTLIIGDLSFFYDRNGLWHNYLPANLRIVLLNNHGGGIFGLIDGPKTQPELQEYFITEQRLDARSAASEYGLEYFQASDSGTLSKGINWLYQSGQKARLLEISTTQAANAAAFQHYFKLIPHASEPMDSH